MMEDIGVSGVDGLPDITVFAGDVDTADALTVAVLASLFSDARAGEGDLPDDTGDPRGWWGDTWAPRKGDRFGCRWWIRCREVVSDELCRWVGTTGTEALAWLVEDGLARKASVTAFRDRTRPNSLVVLVEVTRVDGTRIEMNVTRMWEGLRGA